MASKELRWHLLSDDTGDGTTSEDNGANYTHDNEKKISIKRILWTSAINAAGAGENARSELAKNSAKADSSDGQKQFRLITRVNADGSANDGGYVVHRDLAFDDGELELEHGDSMNLSITKSSGGALTNEILLGYVF